MSVNARLTYFVNRVIGLAVINTPILNQPIKTLLTTQTADFVVMKSVIVTTIGIKLIVDGADFWVSVL